MALGHEPLLTCAGTPMGPHLHPPPHLGRPLYPHKDPPPVTCVDPLTCARARPLHLRWPPHLGGPRTTSPARGRPHRNEAPLTCTFHLTCAARDAPPCAVQAPSHLRGPHHLRRPWTPLHLRGQPHQHRDPLTCAGRAWDSGPAGPNGEGCAGPSRRGPAGPRLRAGDFTPPAPALTPRPGDNETAGRPGEQPQLATSKQPSTSSPSVTEARLSCPRRFRIGPPAARSGHPGSSLGRSAVLREVQAWEEQQRAGSPWWRRAADWTWLREAGSQQTWGRVLGGACGEGSGRRSKGRGTGTAAGGVWSLQASLSPQLSQLARLPLGPRTPTPSPGSHAYLGSHAAPRIPRGTSAPTRSPGSLLAETRHTWVPLPSESSV